MVSLRASMGAGAVLALGLCGQASADVLVLKDGRIVDGHDMTQKEGHVEIAFEAGVVEVKDSLIDILLEDDKEIAFVPQNDNEREKFEKGYVRFEGRWTKIRDARRKVEKGIEARLDEAEADKEHGVWRSRYKTGTKHFDWEHTTPIRTTQRFMDACDAYFDIFAKDWKVKRDKKKPKLKINFFSDRGEFKQVAGAPGGALAYFMFIGDYDLCAFYDRLDPLFTEQVLFHELGHYLHKLIDEDFKYPHWPGESLSEYYGGAEWDPAKKKLTIGLIHNGRLATIKSEMERGEKIELRKMITTKGFEDYTWGWSFVHFLMQDKTRSKNFKKFFIGLARDKKVRRDRGGANLKYVSGEEVLRYFMECMKLESEGDLRMLEQEWYDYINEDLTFDGENALIWEAKTAKSLGETKRAKSLYAAAFKANLAGAPANAHFDYAQMLGGGSKAREHLQHAVDKAPLTAVFRWALADSLEGAKSDETKAKGAVQRAIALELDPDVKRTASRIIVLGD